MAKINGEKYFTVREIAERFDVGQRTVRAWLFRNKLAHIKLVGRVLIAEKELDKFVAKALADTK